MLSSSTCFLHVLFSLPFFHWPSAMKSNALLKTCASSLLNTWPYQLTLFAKATDLLFPSNPAWTSNILIFFYLWAVLHTLLSPWFSALCIIPISLSGTMLHFYTVLLALHVSYKQPLLALEEISCHTASHHTLILTQPHLGSDFNIWLFP